MPHTLLLRLHGPMQSYGIESRFEFRETTLEPTKSAVVGLLCCALGRDRPEPIDDLTSLDMAVRVDAQGRIDEDFHTAKDVITAQGSIKDAQLSYRYYLHDASFLVGLQSENRPILERLHTALKAPHWILFLGRKSCPPSLPVVNDASLVDTDVRTAFQQTPLHPNRNTIRDIRYVVDATLENTFASADLNPIARVQRRDVPVHFGERTHDSRSVTVFLERRSEVVDSGDVVMDHDDLGGGDAS